MRRSLRMITAALGGGAAACGRASARAGCDGGGCEDSRVRADYTIGGCEPHVRGWFLPVFWGGCGAWVKPKIKFAWFMRNILVET